MKWERMPKVLQKKTRHADTHTRKEKVKKEKKKEWEIQGDKGKEKREPCDINDDSRRKPMNKSYICNHL